MQVILFTKESLDTEKHVTLINIPPARFIGGPTKQVIKGNTQRAWDPER